MRFSSRVPAGSYRRHARTLQQGSTLLAALGVIVIIGLGGLLLSMVMHTDAHGKVQLEAQTLARTLALAAAEARYRGKSLAWTAEQSGYRFWQLDPDQGWTELVGNEVLRARVLPKGMSISANAQGIFDQRGAQRVEFAAWGDIPAFAVGLTLDTARYQVTASPLGEFHAAPISGQNGSALGNNVVVLR